MAVNASKAYPWMFDFWGEAGRAYLAYWATTGDHDSGSGTFMLVNGRTVVERDVVVTVDEQSLADQALAVTADGDDGRGRARAFRIFNNLRLAAFHDGDAAVGGAEVNTNDLAHVLSFAECE